MSKIANATPKDGFGTIFDVTYPGEVQLDANVKYGYLRYLVDRGYTVFVGATNNDEAYTLRPVPESDNPVGA